MSSCDTLTINFNSALSVVVIGGLASDALQPSRVCTGVWQFISITSHSSE